MTIKNSFKLLDIGMRSVSAPLWFGRFGKPVSYHVLLILPDPGTLPDEARTLSAVEWCQSTFGPPSADLPRKRGDEGRWHFDGTGFWFMDEGAVRAFKERMGRMSAPASEDETCPARPLESMGITPASVLQEAIKPYLAPSTPDMVVRWAIDAALAEIDATDDRKFHIRELEANCADLERQRDCERTRADGLQKELEFFQGLTVEVRRKPSPWSSVLAFAKSLGIYSSASRDILYVRSGERP